MIEVRCVPTCAHRTVHVAFDLFAIGRVVLDVTPALNYAMDGSLTL